MVDKGENQERKCFSLSLTSYQGLLSSAIE